MDKKIVLLIVPICMLLFVCAFEPAYAASADSWVAKASMNHARAYLGTAAVNGKIYAIGGDEGSETGCCTTGTGMTNNVANYTEEYDPALNQWTEKSSMPTPRALFGTAVYQNKIYCIGGYNGANVKTGPESYNWKTEYYSLTVNEVYDTATDTWTTASPMPTPRNTAATNIVNGKIYVIGGHAMANLYVNYNMTEVYDPQTDSWTTKTSSPLPVTSPASAVIDNKIYVLGENPKESWKKTIEIYDPATDTWVVKDVAPISYAATAVATSGMNALKRIYFFDENRTDVYDPATNSWSVGTPAPTTNRLIPKAAVLDDTIYLIGGRTGQMGHMVFMYPCTLNEQYFPSGYGTPDASTPTPPPTSPPSPPAPAPSGTPTENASLSNEQALPIGEQSNPSSNSVPTSILAISVTAVVMISAVLVVYIVKRHQAG